MSELKPCPFCGEKPLGTTFLDNPFCCDSRGFSVEGWNNAYCWKREAELEASLAEAIRERDAYREVAINSLEHGNPGYVSIKQRHSIIETVDTEAQRILKGESK